MKKSFVASAALVLLSMAIVGCGEDTPTVNVNESFKFKTGDKFTYNYYERDSNNTRIESSKSVAMWTVLRTDLTMFDNTSVTEVQQIRVQTDCITPIDTTILYFSAKETGTLQQYDLIKSTIARFGIDAIEPIVEQIDPAWIQISDTKSPSALSWSFPSNIVKTVDLNLTVVENVEATMDVNSSHQGRKQTVVSAGTFKDAFSTDHQVLLRVVGKGGLTDGQTLINDSVAIHYAVDINAGILWQSMDSKKITVQVLNVPYNVNGFEMELASYTRAN